MLKTDRVTESYLLLIIVQMKNQSCLQMVKNQILRVQVSHQCSSTDVVFSPALKGLGCILESGVIGVLIVGAGETIDE